MTYIIKIGVILAVVIAISRLPWPEIPTEVFDTITWITGTLYYFNRYVAIAELFQYTIYILIIEAGLIAWKILAAIAEGTPSKISDNFDI